MQARDRCIEEQKRNNHRGRHLARQTENGRSCPEQPRDNSDVESGNGEQMQSTGLLERFFNVVTCLMTEPECGAADQADRIRRIFDPATQGTLHPLARARCSTPYGKFAATSQNLTILRVSND